MNELIQPNWHKSKLYQPLEEPQLCKFPKTPNIEPLVTLVRLFQGAGYPFLNFFITWP